MSSAVADNDNNEGAVTDGPGVFADNNKGAGDVAASFGKIDANGDGSISREELWSYVSGISGDEGSGLAKEDFDKLFDAIDTDKSGGIDFTEYARFVERVRGMYALKKMPRSAMKVSTLSESLQVHGKERPTMRNALRKMMRRASTSALADPRRSQMLLDTRRQSGTRSVTLDVEDPPDASPRGGRSASVRFFDVEVREFGMVASDHPCARGGAALEMSWDFSVLEREHLDTFEARRSVQRAGDYKKEKKLSPRERERILREYGATAEEIGKAKKRAASARRARQRSVALRDHDQLYEDIEDARNLLRKIVPFGRRGRKGSAPAAEALDIERLHPTLMAMIGPVASDEKSPQTARSGRGQTGGQTV